MLSKVPADKKIALYVLTKHRGLPILRDYTLDGAPLLAGMDKFVAKWMCYVPPRLTGVEDGRINGMVGASGPGINFPEGRI
jgi:hypothetical protein